MEWFETVLAYRADFPQAVAAIEEWRRDAEIRRKRFAEAHPLLSIGVMGQIKAGKSSFLNMLLFGGKPLLPEAATPKTANLTRIRHGERPFFVAHFYAPESWAALEQLADSAADDETARAARELVTHARGAHGAGIAALLSQQRIEIVGADEADLIGRIGDYVAAEGRFTPLVESSELMLPQPELAGIEIVDTPGMNDPVVSRTDKTREYMAQCDVVYFLSPASRPLDAVDQQILAAHLPSKGVKRLVLVAAQFDAAILDDGFQRKSLAQCMEHLRVRLRLRAQENLEQLASQRERHGFPDIAQLLRAAREPIFASTYAEAFASLPREHWSKSQMHVHEQFAELAQDCWGGHAPNADDWHLIGGFAALRAALDEARRDKLPILEKQRKGLESEIARALGEHLTVLREQACDRIVHLQTKDLPDLDAHAQKMEKRLRTIADTLSGYVSQQANTARAEVAKLTAGVAKDAQRARHVEARTGYKTQWKMEWVKDFTLWKPWTWWGKGHYESYSTITPYSYLLVSDAIESLRQFIAQARNDVLARLGRLISPQTLSVGLRRELLQALDTRSEDFDPRGLHALVESSLAAQAWPDLDFEVPDPASALANFPAEVRSHAEMNSLRENLNRLVESLEQTFIERLDRAVGQLCDRLDAIAGHLRVALSETLTADLERLRADMADKQNQIERFSALLQVIDAQHMG